MSGIGTLPSPAPLGGPTGYPTAQVGGYTLPLVAPVMAQAAPAPMLIAQQSSPAMQPVTIAPRQTGVSSSPATQPAPLYRLAENGIPYSALNSRHEDLDASNLSSQTQPASTSKASMTILVATLSVYVMFLLGMATMFGSQAFSKNHGGAAVDKHDTEDQKAAAQSDLQERVAAERAIIDQKIAASHDTANAEHARRSIPSDRIQNIKPLSVEAGVR